jgi:hypothetical protein
MLWMIMRQLNTHDPAEPVWRAVMIFDVLLQFLVGLVGAPILRP